MYHVLFFVVFALNVQSGIFHCIRIKFTLFYICICIKCTIFFIYLYSYQKYNFLYFIIFASNIPFDIFYCICIQTFFFATDMIHSRSGTKKNLDAFGKCIHLVVNCIADHIGHALS